MEETKKCPKCGGEMEKGHITSAVFSSLPKWIKEGKSTKIGAPTITQYACLKCGFIEGYVYRAAIR